MTVTPITLDEWRKAIVKLMDDDPRLPAPGVIAAQYVRDWLERLEASAAKWGVEPDEDGERCPECGHALYD